MTKRAIRTCIAWGCRASTLLAFAEWRNRGRLPILCYHRVLPAGLKNEYPFPDLVVTPEAFRRQCRALAGRFEVLPLTPALERWSSGAGAGRPLAVITFDDGYRDNYEYAAPVLAETRLRATFFVVAGLAGTEQAPWYDRMARAVDDLRRAGRVAEVLSATPLRGDAAATTPRGAVAKAKGLCPDERARALDVLEAETGGERTESSRDLIMDWSQLRELAEAGHEIGSHSMTHEILPHLDDAALDTEVAGSRRLLERETGHPVSALCYPNGDFDERTLRAVESAGYTSAVTVESGLNRLGTSPFQLKRWFIHEDRLAGPGGNPSDTLLRMELCGLAERLFARGRHRGEPR